MFALYVLPFSDIVRQHSVSMQSYADDTQLYISFNHRALSSMSILLIISGFECWKIDGKNGSKAEMMTFASSRVNLPAFSIAVGTESDQPARHVGKPGLTL